MQGREEVVGFSYKDSTLMALIKIMPYLKSFKMTLFLLHNYSVTGVLHIAQRTPKPRTVCFVCSQGTLEGTKLYTE